MAATRISGICFGVFCSVTLSVIIFPKSANCEAVDSMANALTDLSAFHALAWTGGRSEAPPGTVLLETKRFVDAINPLSRQNPP